MTSVGNTRTDNTAQIKSVLPAAVLQRKCACGQHTPAGGECAGCRDERTKNPLQAKLRIGEANDIYEQEADRVADKVMQTPRSIEDGSNSQLETVPLVQRRVSSAQNGVIEVPPAVHDAIRTSGNPLDRATRNFMEPRFGHDFSGVRVHTGAQAEKSALAVNARAYTLGQDVVFGRGEYAPTTPAGQRLLAHELAHTIQQASHPRRIQRLVRVQPGASAIPEILGYFNTICPGGGFTPGANDQIDSACASSAGDGCGCLCDVTTDQNREYVIRVFNVTNNPAPETLHDGTTQPIPKPSEFPKTTRGTHPVIHMPSANAPALVFGAFRADGTALPVNNTRILAHELCGHGRLDQSYSGGPGNRQGHDVTITTANAIIGGDARGLFTSTRQGESFYNLPSSIRRVFALTDGWHYEDVP